MTTKLKAAIRVCQPTAILLLVGVLHLGLAAPAGARVSGECANCHTMHNSQNGSSMAWDGSASPSAYLTRGDCVSCHAQNGADRIITLGVSEIPQVLHTDTTDLAGGNFRYLADNDNRGHNVIDLGNLDDIFAGNLIPGGISEVGHQGGTVGGQNLTCAGANGCHGVRNPSGPSGIGALAGSHHNDVEGRCDVANAPYNSYRFLSGVKGYENQTDKWQNVSAASHNEYSGITSPPQLGCAGGSVVHCHGTGSEPVQPPTGTISGFCATCHGNFHTLTVGTGDDSMGNSSGLGNDTLSPFIRHPTDIVIKATGEYAAYTTYNINAPVGRTTGVPSAASSVVTPGSDVVTCLSCHMSHASNYPDMLRWDYSGMLAHDSNADTGNGCFICHTTKDDF